MTPIVVIGTSSGGVEALRSLVSAIPANFGAPICVVLHRPAHSVSLIAGILERAGRLPAQDALGGERLEPGRIYVAPADQHLLIEPGHVRLSRGPRENLSRPAIDPLFRSAAQVYGPAAIGVVLTGDLDDGAAGLDTIRRLGGVTIVQDPEDAQAPSMPAHALSHGPVDHCLALQDIPGVLVDEVARYVAPAAERAPVPGDVEVEVKIAAEAKGMDTGLGLIAEPSVFACPECHGVLLRLKQAHPARFRCHTGHAYSSVSLAAAFETHVEDALWGAVRALEEASMLLREMARAERSVDPPDAMRAQAARNDADGAVLRGLLGERASRAAG